MSVGNEKHRVLHESQEHNLGKKTKAEGKGKRSKKAFQKSPYNIWAWVKNRWTAKGKKEKGDSTKTQGDQKKTEMEKDSRCGKS